MMGIKWFLGNLTYKARETQLSKSNKAGRMEAETGHKLSQISTERWMRPEHTPSGYSGSPLALAAPLL